MRRLKLVLQYDGSAYFGWQGQPGKKLPTIQAKLEEALTLVFKEPVKVMAAGRTDRGVHAEGQVAALDTNSKMPADLLVCALNSILPGDIVVVSGEEVSADFHPRYDAQKKWYRYTIFHDRLPNVFLRKHSLHVPYQLDLAAMIGAALYFEGTHDFRSLCSVKAGVKNFVRTVEQCRLEKQEKILNVDMVAGGFLYNMARIMVGTLLEVGRGKIEPQAVREIIAGRDRRRAGPTVLPAGLCLKKVIY